jgi:serine/threonine-protein kinase HipA
MEMETVVFLFREGVFQPIGRLRFFCGGRESYASFAYGERYLRTSTAVSIDPFNLPLRPGAFHTEVGVGLFGAIRDAGPDLWGRYLLEKKFGRELNELEYNLATGVHRVGALAFGPTPECPKILRNYVSEA